MGEPARDESEPEWIAPSPAELRRVQWVSLAGFLALSLPFLFFFYDAFNLNDTIFGSSLLYLGITPYNPGLGSTILVGYPLLPYNQAILGSYLGTSYSVLGAAVLGKFLLLVATYGAALILLRILIEERVRSWRVLYYTFLFNPFLLFVNVVWGETDALIILGLFATVYLLRYEWERRGLGVGLFGGVVVLAMISFGYFTPVLLAPAFVIYASTRRAALTLLATLAGIAALFAVPMFGLGLNPLAVRSIGSVAVFNPYSIVSLFTEKGSNPGHLGLYALLGASILGAVLAPILLRRAGVPFEVSALTVFSIELVLAIGYFEPDNFVIVVGLVPLAIASVRTLRARVWHVLLLEIGLLPVLWIANMWNGPGQVSGIYYWGYFWIGRSENLFGPLGGDAAWRACLVLSAVLPVASCVYLIARARRGRAESPPVVPRPAPGRMRYWGPPQRTGGPTLTWAVIVVALAVPLVAAAIPGQTYELNSVGAFPSQFFLVHDYEVPKLYLLPGPTTYSTNPTAGTASIAPGAPRMAFVRALSQQSFDFNLSVTTDAAAIPVGGPLGVLNASGTWVGFARAVSLTPSVLPVQPVSSTNLTPIAGASLVLSNLSALYATNGSGLRTYSLDSVDMSGESFLFSVRLSGYATSQNLLWDATEGGVVVLEAYLVGGTFYFANFVSGQWRNESAAVQDPRGASLLVGISVATNNSFVTASVNDVALSFPVGWPSGPSDQLYVGKFGPDPIYDGAQSLAGAISDAYVLPSASVPTRVAPFVGVPGDEGWLAGAYGSQVEATYSGDPSDGTLDVSGARFPIGADAPTIAFGKLSNATAAVDFTFHQIRLGSVGWASLLPWTVVEFGLAAPAVVAWWYFRSRPPRGASTAESIPRTDDPVRESGERVGSRPSGR